MKNNEPHEVGELEIEDDEGFIDRELKKEIIDARRRFYDIAFEAQQASFRYSEENLRLILYRSAQAYLARSEPLLRDDDLPGARHYYLEENIGYMSVEPPLVDVGPHIPFEDVERSKMRQRVNEAEGSPQYKIVRKGDVPTEKTVPVKGLKPIIERESVTAEWEIQVEEINGKPVGTPEIGEKMTISNTEIWTFDILERAVRIATRFLDDAGIGLSARERTDDAGFDYDQLLEEGPPA